MFFEDVETEWFLLTLPNCLHAGEFKPKVKPSNACKKARHPDSLTVPAAFMEAIGILRMPIVSIQKIHYSASTWLMATNFIKEAELGLAETHGSTAAISGDVIRGGHVLSHEGRADPVHATSVAFVRVASHPSVGLLSVDPNTWAAVYRTRSRSAPVALKSERN